MCGREDTLFTPLLQFARVPFQTKGSVHKTPFWENFSLYSLNFCPNFSSQAPKFGNFQLTCPQIWKFSVHITSPQIWKFSVHKAPFLETSISSQAPHFGNPGRTPLPENKLSAPRVLWPPLDKHQLFSYITGFSLCWNIAKENRKIYFPTL